MSCPRKAKPRGLGGARGGAIERGLPEHHSTAFDRALQLTVDAALDCDDATERRDPEALHRALRALLSNALSAHALGGAML